MTQRTALDNMRDEVTKGRQPRGGVHPSSKLTSSQAAEIRAEYARGGVTQSALADRYGVKQPAISRIIRGVSY